MQCQAGRLKSKARLVKSKRPSQLQANYCEATTTKSANSTDFEVSKRAATCSSNSSNKLHKEKAGQLQTRDLQLTAKRELER